ncbi:MAG: molybdenum cofactor biosynthesis protein MoeB [Spirochaeta sp.]|nr:molybdenum cofactor biosynthesis protein MoeB [Spirochaeta sp.]RPG03894.1 MAG: molybdopterin-synthase adenylyltransferase MoeB [Proteobacteria bacterium TMED72]
MSHGEGRLQPQQFERYRRHLSLPEMGPEGQLRLLQSKVLLIGAGGLGCPLALYLAAAGVGRLGLVDDDVVDLSNLQRQVLYGTDDVGRPKVEVARDKIHALNPDVQVDVFSTRLDSSNALEIFEDYDVIVDGTDNFPTRYLSNDACVLLGKPNVYGSILRFDGQASVFDAREGPCYRCLFPEPPPPGSVPSCEEGGVLGVLPGLIATIQATETIKILTGLGRTLVGRLLLYDALAMEWTEFALKKDPACPACGDNPTVTELIDYQGFCGVESGAADRVQVPGLPAASVAKQMESGEELLLLDVRDPEEVARAAIDGSRRIPLAELEGRLAEIENWKRRPVVVHCHKGGRSARACEVLMSAGFEEVSNLDGGIEAWSLTVDDNVPRY